MRVEGSLIGLKHNDEIYYYVKNIQEDIIGITDSNNNLLCSYVYDSWGNIISIKDNDGNIINDTSHIGIINPYRYRSYYYDKETKLYYLNSRYYNPEWGRFINADSFVYTAQDMHSTNMYAYTENNQICRADTLGVFWFTVAGGALGGVTNVVINGTMNVANGDDFGEGGLGSFISGAYYGAMNTTSLSYTFTGQVAMNYGSALISNVFTAIEDFENDNYLFGDITVNTIIDGTMGMLIPNPVKTNENWIRPTKISTSFFGKYQRKLIVNQGLTNSRSFIRLNKIKALYSNYKAEQLSKRKQFPKNAIGPVIGCGLSKIYRSGSGFNAIAGYSGKTNRFAGVGCGCSMLLM